MVSCWYYTAIHCTAEKIKSNRVCRDSHGDISNHRTEASNISQLNSSVDTGHFSLLKHSIKKCPRNGQFFLIYKKDLVPKNEESALNTQLFNIYFLLLSAWLCSSPPFQIVARHEGILKLGPCSCDGGWATGSQVQVQIKAAAHCVFNRNGWSCNICQKKKKKLQVVTDWHPKPQKIFTSILLAIATHLKRQEQNYLLISWMCCENKFL